METGLFLIVIKNVPNEYVLGRIVGQLDITANLAEDRHKRSYGLCKLADNIWLYKIRSQEDILKGVINEIEKWVSVPDVSIEFNKLD